MNISTILAWYQRFLLDAKLLTDFMLTDIITLGNITFTPLTLLTGSGLIAYIVIAFFKWIR